MTRPHNPRRVGFFPRAVHFKPAGVKKAGLEEVVLGNDEMEAVRLKDLLGMSQSEAAREMGISQPTFHRLILTARQKIADAFVNGKAVKIEGGNIDADGGFSQPCHWRKRWGCKAKADCSPGGGPGKTRSKGKLPRIVAVTSVDGGLEGMVDERFGRSRKIIIFDRETGSFEVMDNGTNMNAPQGAGVTTAERLAGTRAEAVISGHLGPNAFHVLESAGIEAYSAAHMTASQAIGGMEKGSLVRLDKADVKGHW